MISLSWVVDNRRKDSNDVKLGSAIHGTRHLITNPLYSLNDSLPRWHVIRANRALHESFIWEYIMRMTCNEITNGKDEALTTANVP